MTAPDATELPAIQAAHLTEVLRRHGVPSDGHVKDVTIESSNDTLLSRIVRIRLTYDDKADAAPSSLILKTKLPGGVGEGWNIGKREVAFYNQVAPAMPIQIVPRCFDAHWDKATKAWHLLLEDLTDSHAVAARWPLPPSLEQSTRIVRALARFHAVWWDDPRLGTSLGTWVDAGAMDQWMRGVANDCETFAGRVGDLLPRERRALYERLLDRAPRLLARYHSHRSMTIVHMDAHVLNTMLPHDDGSDDVRFLDWDGWRIGVGSNDLAYMMAVHWYPDRRRRVERLLLDQYHAELAAQGVRGYDRRALEDDYRWSVLWHILTPMWQAVNNIPPVVWWNNLERVMLAVDDLDCQALLG